jgi:hypothetical protein
MASRAVVYPESHLFATSDRKDLQKRKPCCDKPFIRALAWLLVSGFEYGSRMFFGRLRIRLKAFACQAKASRALAAIPPISSTLTCMFLIGRAHFMAAVFPRTPAIADLFAARPLLSSVKRGKYFRRALEECFQCGSGTSRESFDTCDRIQMSRARRS